MPQSSSRACGTGSADTRRRPAWKACIATRPTAPTRRFDLGRCRGFSDGSIEVGSSKEGGRGEEEEEGGEAAVPQARASVSFCWSESGRRCGNSACSSYGSDHFGVWGTTADCRSRHTVAPSGATRISCTVFSSLAITTDSSDETCLATQRVHDAVVEGNTFSGRLTLRQAITRS